MAIQTRMEVYDLAGNPVCTCRSTHAVFAFGGFGGPKPPSHTLTYPDLAPDYSATEHLSDTQAALYRLSGDTYDVHIDPAVAKRFGFEGPFMQGLGTYGFACRMGIQQVIPFEPERLKRMYAQMRSICYPGQDVTFQGWGAGEGTVYFRLLSDSGAVLLDNGVLEYR